LDKRNLGAVLGRAKLQDDRQQYEQCLKTLDEALAIDAKRVSTHLFRASVLRKVNKFNGKMNYFYFPFYKKKKYMYIYISIHLLFLFFKRCETCFGCLFENGTK